ncbi:MAG: hypothetical protein NVSMB21_21940 [Vulcanimicrobiaceae bacterium]
MTSSRQAFLAAAAAAVSAAALAPAVASAASPTGMASPMSSTMMMSGAKLVVFYKTPADQKKFEAYYYGTHAPLAAKLPGLRSYVVSTTPIATPDGKPSALYSFFAELTFDSLAALSAALGSAQGGVVVGDLKNFAQAGVDITVFQTKAIV